MARVKIVDKSTQAISGDIVSTEPKKRKHGKVNHEIFKTMLIDGYTQKEAYLKASGGFISDENARVEGSKLAKKITTDSNTKEDFLSALKKKREEALASLTQDKLEKANARDTAISLGILIEKVQLLSGQPTENVASLHLLVTAEELKALNDADLESRLLGN